MRKDELDLEEAMVTAAKTAESESKAGNEDPSADSRKSETLLDDSEPEAPTSTAPAAVDPSTEESADSGKKIEG